MWRKRDGSSTRLEFRELLDDDPAMIEPEDTMESRESSRGWDLLSWSRV